MATTATQREKPQSHLLHPDFSSPTLKPWRRHRLLQYDTDAGERRSAPRPPAKDGRLPFPRIGDPVIGDDDGSLKELREKLLGHLREAADKMRLEMPSICPAAPAAEKAGEAERPWNLRSRTSARRTAADSPAKASERTMRLRSECSEKEKKKNKRRRFSVSLSREEIEEDVFALTGSRPRRRPKKRPRSVQWQLDALFPGLWLSEIRPELYKVAE